MAIRLIIRRRDAGEGATPAAQTFDDPIITIGNDPSATLHLDDRAIAPEQAAIIASGDDEPPLLINRADGTLLNGESLAREARRPLSDGDRISVGPYVISLATGNGFLPGADVTETVEEDAAGLRTTRETPALPDAETTPAAPASNSFAAILDSLRTEEDTFYFQVETADGGRRRVPVEGSGMLLGWDRTGQNVTCGDAGAVATVRAVIHKDWSGVILQPERPGAAAINGETVEAPRRLRNGDRVTLRPATGAASHDAARNFFIFYEPASLVVLDSLLPAQQLPPPVAPAPPEAGAALVPAPAPAPPARTPPPRLPLSARTYFGYFTFGEVALMVCATLVAAVIIFLILEYS
jgi:hypothetical protein